MSFGVSGTYVGTPAQLAASVVEKAKLDATTVKYWEVVATSTVSGAAVQDVTFTGLDLESAKFYQLCGLILNPAGGTDPEQYYLFANGDTTVTNYYSQRVTGNHNVISGERINAPRIGYCDHSQQVSLNMILTKNTGVYPRGSQDCAIYTGSTICTFQVGWTRTNTENVTSLTIHGLNGAFIGIGSTFMLLKFSA